MTFPLDKFSKENILTKQTYQIRTRQYSNINSTPTVIKTQIGNIVSNQNDQNQLQLVNHTNKQSQYSKSPKNNGNIEEASFSKYQQSNVFRQYNKQHSQNKYGIVNWAAEDKNQNYHNNKRNEEKESLLKSQFNKNYLQNSFSDISKFGEPSKFEKASAFSFKRQNARAKDIEIKMNNIDQINDKINTLLNMVKHDSSISRRSNNKSQGKSQLRMHEATFIGGKIEGLNGEKASIFQEKLLSPKGKFYYNNQDLINKLQKGNRARTCSGFQKHSDNIDNVSKFGKQKYWRENEEENLLINNRKDIEYKNDEKWYGKYGKPYLQHQNIKSKIKQKQDRQSYSMTPKEKSWNKDRNLVYSKHNKDNIDKSINYILRDQPSFAPSNINSRDYKASPFVRKENYEDHNYKPNFGQPQYVPFFKATLNKQTTQENCPIPLSLQSQEKYCHQKQPSARFIDARLIKIKQKIKESQSQKKFIQRRLDSGFNEQKVDQNSEVKAGKLYRKYSVSPVKPFELKVHPVQIDKKNTVKIAEKLGNQVQIDNRLRVARQQFCSQPGQEKWAQLQRKLKGKGVKLSAFQIKQLIAISPNEFEPLQNQSYLDNFPLQSLLQECQRHWERQVYGCANLRGLKNENFDILEIDTNGKGYITLEDIVSFINLYTGQSYESGDVTLIYRRLQLLQESNNTTNIQYQTFLRVIAL